MTTEDRIWFVVQMDSLAEDAFDEGLPPITCYAEMLAALTALVVRYEEAKRTTPPVIADRLTNGQRLARLLITDPEAHRLILEWEDGFLFGETTARVVRRRLAGGR